MKTLFFVVAGVLLGLIPTYAQDEIPWHATNQHDIAGSIALHLTPTLENLKTALKIGPSMSGVVAQCGLPDAEYDPKKWPTPRGIMMSGGIIYQDGFFIGEEDYLRFRYDLPGEGQIYVTTDKDQCIKYAFFESTEGQSQYLVGEPVITRIKLKSTKAAP